MSVIAWMLLVTLGQAHITDPIADYVDFNPQFDGFEHDLAELEVLRLDMDADGSDEVLVRSRDGYRDRQGASWVVYTPSADGYVRVNGFAHFFATQAYVGDFDDVRENSGFVIDRGRGIITFGTMGSGKGTLVGIQLEDEALTVSRLRVIDAKFQDKELYEKLFQQDRFVPEVVDSERIEELRASLEQSASWVIPEEAKEADRISVAIEAVREPKSILATKEQNPNQRPKEAAASPQATSKSPNRSRMAVIAGISLAALTMLAGLLIRRRR